MSSGIVRIAHLSDPHFGAQGAKATWESLVDYLCSEVKPELVLVTGDLADSPKRKWLREAYSCLESLNKRLGYAAAGDKKYIVCAGNHDRHWRGNAIPFKRASTKFDGVQFGAPGVSAPNTRWLGVAPHRWKVRVATVDSSVRARYSAQAFLGRKELTALSNLKEWADEDEPPFLVLLMIHHHLLPLPANEPETQSVWELLRPTSAVNPGTILEHMASSLVDVVLHGHEHKRNLARYASYRADAGQVAVVAAGSATGNETTLGCGLQRASFNILELRPDRSVWISEARHLGEGASKWQVVADSTVELLDSTTLRQNRFARSRHLWRKAQPIVGARPNSDWQKHVILTEGRDAFVRERRTNWQIKDGLFGFPIRNDTGQPVEFKADLVGTDRGIKKVSLAPVSGQPGAYEFLVELDTKDPVSVTSLNTSYHWLDAVLLTEGDFSLIDKNQAGPFRSDGKEFIAASVRYPLGHLTLTATFPVGYAPTSADVYYENLAELDPKPLLAESLSDRLQFTGQTWVLNIPYPLKDYRYAIAWRPIAVAPSPQRIKMQDRATRLGNKLATKFLETLGDAAWSKRATVAIYVPDPEQAEPNRYLQQVGLAPVTLVTTMTDPPPPSLDLRQNKGLYLHAWWGDTGIAVVEPGDDVNLARTQGMRVNERVTATMPLRGSDSRSATLSGIIRVGVMKGPPDADPATNLDDFRAALERGHVAMLYALLSETGEIDVHHS